MKSKKYYELYNKIKSDIYLGVYKAGEKLPSKRNMASLQGVSQITVLTAYEMLEAEGFIAPKERSGYFVLKVTPPNVHYKHIDKLSEETPAISEHFEYSLWFKTVRKVISEKDKELFIKAPSEGCAVLRNAIANYLVRYRDIAVSPKNVIIGSGAEQLYENVVKLLGRDKVIGVENPCYSQIIKVYEEEGAKTLALEMGENGIKSAELKKPFQILHVTPYSSYPSGVTATLEKRREYALWAKESGGYIVEDDYKSEFFTDKYHYKTLKAISPEHVIYINTFSHSLSPSMRVGYMILPDNLLSIYKERLGGFSCSVPVLEQYCLAEFINSGSFERHLNREKRKIKRGEA